MADTCKRKLKKGDTVYVISCEDTEILVTQAQILKVDNETFCAVIYENKWKKYAFKDFGRIFFYTKQEAEEVATRLPTPNSIVYHLVGNHIHQRKVIGIYDKHINGVTNLLIRFHKSRYVPIEKIGCELFLREVDARRKKYQ